MRSSSPRPSEASLLFLYTPLVRMGGAERNFLEEVHQFRQHGVASAALTFRTSADAPAGTAVDVVPAQNVFATVAALRRHLRHTGARLLIAHTSPPLAYLGTLGTGVPYVLYLNSPPFYKGYPENKVIYSWRFSRLVRGRIAQGGPRYAEFLPSVTLGPRQRVDVEARALLTTLAVRHAAAVIVWSRRAADEITQVYGVEPVVLQGCIPDALAAYVPRTNVRVALGLSAHQRVVLTVSRLDPIKRVDLLIRAFAVVKASSANAVLVVVGTGPDEARLRALASELRTDVIFTGYVPDESLWDYYAASDVFVTPALADFNIAPYEALALGRRVVWSSEMDPDESLRRCPGLITAEPSVDAFADAIARALALPPPEKCDMRPYLWSTRYAQLSSLFDTILRRNH